MNPQDPRQDPLVAPFQPPQAASPAAQEASSQADQPSDEVCAWLSALTDGEADPVATTGACSAWRDEPGARAVWHRYQLIGDVLRSSELASPASRDAAFLSAVRAKLATEPAVLAPAPLLRPTVPEAKAAAASAAATTSAVQTAQRRFGWRVPTAAAAGFAAVAGVLLVMRLAAPPAPVGGALQARAPGAPEYLLAGAAGPAATPSVTAGVIRDARLDAYLSAHQAARVRGLAAVPGGALRQVDGVVAVSAER